MELKWFYTVVVIQGLSSAAQELTVTPTDVRDSIISNGTMTDVDVRDSIISNGTMTDVDVRDSIISNGTMTDVDVRDSIISNGTMTDVDVRVSIISNGTMTDMDVRDSIISNGTMTDVDVRVSIISNGTMTDVDVRDSIISNGTMTDMDVRDSIISNGTMTDDCNNTANQEEKQTNSDSPFALIHSGSMTEATYNSFLVVYGYIQVPLSVIALATNICSVIVFSQKRMKSPSSTILLALCASEVLFLICLVTSSIMRLIYGTERLTKRIYLLYGICIDIYVAVAVRRAALCYACLVSAERFITVTFPLQAKSMRLVKHPGVVCALIMAVSFVAHIYSPLKYVVISKQASDNTTTYGIQYSSMYAKDKVHFDNSSTASKFIFVYFMLFGCLMFNLLIVISLRRHSKGRQSIKTNQNSGETQKREMQKTITIVASTLVFVILALPMNTSSFVGIFNDDYAIFAKEHFLFMTMNEVGGLCELVSTFTDFFFYIALSTAFRESFLEVFVPCATRGKPGKRIGTGSSSLSTTSTDISRSNGQ